MKWTRREIIEGGAVGNVLELVSRLQDFLPEYGKTRLDEAFANQWREVDELERRLVNARAKMRETALRILGKAESNWSKKELNQATGYGG